MARITWHHDQRHALSLPEQYQEFEGFEIGFLIVFIESSYYILENRETSEAKYIIILHRVLPYSGNQHLIS